MWWEAVELVVVCSDVVFLVENTSVVTITETICSCPVLLRFIVSLRLLTRCMRDSLVSMERGHIVTVAYC